LLQGFESTLKEMPAIAERQLGPVEQFWKDAAEHQAKTFGDGLAESIAQQNKAAEDAVQSIVDGIAGFDIPAPEIPEVPPVAVPPVEGADAATEAITSVADAAKETANELKATFSGSAAAQLARYQAAFA